MKDFLPDGMLPKDAEGHKPAQFSLPSATMTTICKAQSPPYDDDFEPELICMDM